MKQASAYLQIGLGSTAPYFASRRLPMTDDAVAGRRYPAVRCGQVFVEPESEVTDAGVVVVFSALLADGGAGLVIVLPGYRRS